MVLEDRAYVSGKVVAEAEAELREKNQVTVPKPIAEALHIQPGDRLVFVVEDNNRDTVHVHKLRASYEGCLAGIYGAPEEVQEYLTGEREAWDE